VVGLFRRLVVFLRWLVASERLPDPAHEGPRAGAPRRRFFRWLLKGDRLEIRLREQEEKARPRGFLGSILSGEVLAVQDAPVLVPPIGFWVWVTSSEKLPDPSPSTGRVIAQASVVRRLLSFEECPAERPGTAPRKRRFGEWLLSGERCPECDAPSRRIEQEFHRWLLGGEECPDDTRPVPRARAGFLGWLFSPEDCPDGGGPAPRRRRGFLRWVSAREQL